MDRILQIMNQTGMNRTEAEAWYEKKLTEREAAQDARIAADEAYKAEIADQPINAATIKKVLRKYERGINKTQRSNWRDVLGSQWEAFANPQTRANVIETLTQLDGEKLLSFSNH